MSDVDAYTIYPRNSQHDSNYDEAPSYFQGGQTYRQGASGQVMDNQGPYTRGIYTQGLYNQGQGRFNPEAIVPSPYSQQRPYDSNNYIQHSYPYRYIAPSFDVYFSAEFAF